jgi:23S rRNA (cytidine1920-2'-O)/16S rRNA (cytidine1409-2'-O)-methyltransferase
VTEKKPGRPVDPAAEIVVDDPARCYVSRSALKLAAALDHFALDPNGATALDIGASTGGFTDVLLRRGARQVVALDVGHGQLDWRLRTDPRVIVLEHVNARTLRAEDLPAEARAFDIVTIDVSFISLRLVLPAVPPLLAPHADVVALVKPQFEAGRLEVGKGGVVRDEAVRARVVGEIADAAVALGLTRAGLCASPITGMEGNQEYLLHVRNGEAR